MSLRENIYIEETDQIIDINEDNLRVCFIKGPANYSGIKLQFGEFNVPESAEFTISNLTIDNDTLNNFKSGLILSNCRLQDIDGLSIALDRKYRELNNVSVKFGKKDSFKVQSSKSIDFSKDAVRNCDIILSKLKSNQDLNQEFFDKLASLGTDEENITLQLSKKQIEFIQENDIKINNRCNVCIEIENASELSPQEIDELSNIFNISLVKITPKENENSYYSHHVYKVEEYKKSVEMLHNILEGLDKDEPDKAKVLADIYKRLAFHMKYDHAAVDDPKIKEERKVSSRNLVGGLLQKECVCAGYAEILRNACAIAGIKARYVHSKEDITFHHSCLYDMSFFH